MATTTRTSTWRTAGGGKQPPLIPTGGSTTRIATVADSDVAVKAYIPNFFALKNSGVLLPVNGYSRAVSSGTLVIPVYTESVLTYSAPYAKDVVKNICNDWLTAAPVLTGTVSALYADQRSVADNDAKERFANHVSNVIVDLPTELYELKESSDMVLHRTEQLISYAANFRKKNSNILRQFKKFLKNQNHSGRINISRGTKLKGVANDINNMFLEYNYGWVPLYHTFLDACELVEGQLAGKKPVKKVSGKGVFETRDVTTLGSVPVYGSNSVRTGNAYYQRIVEYKYQVWFGGILKEDASTSRATVKQQLGLSLSDIPMSLWEMTYLSFIADYFSNVSGVIGNLRGAATRVYSQTMYKSTKVEAVYKLEGTKVLFPGTFPAGQKCKSSGYFGTSTTQRIMLFNRTPVVASDMLVSFNFKSPTMDHVIKTLSVAAAISGALR